MTDWDDDEFGTFESAETTSPTGSVVSCITSTTPTWLLASSVSQENVQGSESKPEENLLVIAPKNEDLSSSYAKDAKDQLKPSEDILKSEDLENVSLEKSNTSHSTNGWNAFPVQAEDKSGIEKFEIGQYIRSNQSILPDNHTFDDIFASDKQSNLVEENTPAANVEDIIELKPKHEDEKCMKESDLVLELRSKLDTALAVNEQTEKSIGELRNELSHTLKSTRLQRERKEEEHKQEIKRIKEQKEEEISQLKEESQKMMELLSQKYASFASLAAEQQKAEQTKNVEDIVQKCLGIMEQQNVALSQKLSEEGTLHSNQIAEIMQKCKLDMEEFVKKECDSATESCSLLKKEAEKLIKESLEEEFEKQRQVDLIHKKKAMAEMKEHLIAEMKETLKIEREKHVEATRAAVDEVRRTARDAFEKEQRINKISQDRHMMALQMLLASSQEQLRHLAQTISDETGVGKPE